MTNTITTPALIDIEPFGPVQITPKRNMKNVVARISPEGAYRVSAPHGIDQARLTAILQQLLPKLAEKHRSRHADKPPLSDSFTYAYPEGVLSIVRADIHPLAIHTSVQAGNITIGIGHSVDPSMPQARKLIKAQALRAARHLVATHVLPMARQTASALGIDCVGWETGTATTLLGTCHSRRRLIRLSALTLFLPTHLRRLVICHELAHLTHPDHSRAFHALVDKYCNGQEQNLTQQLKLHRFPF